MNPADLAGVYVAIVIVLAVLLTIPWWRDEPSWKENEE